MGLNLNQWLDNESSQVAAKLEDLNKEYYFKEKTLDFASKERTLRALQGLRSALLPGVFEKYSINEDHVRTVIGNGLRAAAIDLNELIEQALVNSCDHREAPGLCEQCTERANDITVSLLRRLPALRELLQTDVQAAYDGDPAARSNEEIMLSYPSFEAVSIHRIAHELYLAHVPLIPRVMSEYAHRLTGIDIHPGATIGRYFFIDHGTGVVIGETCVIGEHVKLYQGVTLGAKSFQLDDQGNPVKGVKRHPDIGDNVIIYAGATILGGNTVIGHDTVIGGNVWLTHSVPPNSTIYNAQPSLVIKGAEIDPELGNWVI